LDTYHCVYDCKSIKLWILKTVHFFCDEAETSQQSFVVCDLQLCLHSSIKLVAPYCLKRVVSGYLER
jgi:hypothetical protein